MTILLVDQNAHKIFAIADYAYVIQQGESSKGPGQSSSMTRQYRLLTLEAGKSSQIMVGSATGRKMTVDIHPYEQTR